VQGGVRAPMWVPGDQTEAGWYALHFEMGPSVKKPRLSEGMRAVNRGEGWSHPPGLSRRLLSCHCAQAIFFLAKDNFFSWEQMLRISGSQTLA